MGAKCGRDGVGPSLETAVVVRQERHRSAWRLGLVRVTDDEIRVMLVSVGLLIRMQVGR